MARTTIATPGFLDRLGDRVVVSDRAGGDLEVLRLRPELTADPAFETCLKARAEELAAFTHRCAPRVRGISRLPAPDGRLAVVSEAAKGWRLSEVLQAAEHESHLIHTGTVLFVLRQVASVVTSLQAVSPDISHGALGPERVVLSPGGRVFVVEYVLGTALAHLPPSSADRLWKDFRLAVPADDAERFSPHTDVLQLGIVALSLIHNRLLRRDEYPGRLPELLDTATESRLTGARQPIGSSLRRWLEHALGLAADGQAWTMADAQQGLDWIVSKEGGYFSTPVGLEPLLRSVELFFTVPAATDGRAMAEISAATPVARQKPAAQEQAVVPPHVVTAPPSPAPELVMPDRVEPVSAPVPQQARVLSLVQAAAESPAEDAQALSALTPDRPLHPATFPTVKESPLAAFAAERVSDVPPPPLPATEPPPARPALRPVPPLRPVEPVAESGPAAVAPVADMLSIDRPSSPRRSGWNDEAWLSRSTDRQPSGARSSVGGSGATARISKSGGSAGAVALKPKEVLEEVAAPAPAAPAPSPDRVASPAAKPAPAAPAPLSRPLFGFAAEEQEGHAEEETAPSHSAGKVKLLAAAAALVILCLGGVAAWWLLQPSPNSNAGGSTANSTPSAVQKPLTTPGASEAAAPAAAPSPAPAESGKAPAPAEVPPVELSPATGSVLIVSAVPMQVSEKGQALGNSLAALPLAAGRHLLDLSNEEVGYHATHVVDVRPGRVARLAPALPKGSVNLNATPWAEVLVDGQRVGETPLGNVQMTVGAHEIRFRHPQLGEQVRTVVVTTGAPGRLSVDMKQ